MSCLCCNSIRFRCCRCGYKRRLRYRSSGWEPSRWFWKWVSHWIKMSKIKGQIPANTWFKKWWPSDWTWPRWSRLGGSSLIFYRRRSRWERTLRDDACKRWSDQNRWSRRRWQNTRNQYPFGWRFGIVLWKREKWKSKMKKSNWFRVNKSWPEAGTTAQSFTRIWKCAKSECMKNMSFILVLTVLCDAQRCKRSEWEFSVCVDSAGARHVIVTSLEKKSNMCCAAFVHAIVRCERASERVREWERKPQFGWSHCLNE